MAIKANLARESGWREIPSLPSFPDAHSLSAGVLQQYLKRCESERPVSLDKAVY